MAIISVQMRAYSTPWSQVYVMHNAQRAVSSNMRYATWQNLSKLTESLGRAVLDIPHGSTTEEWIRPTIQWNIPKSCLHNSTGTEKIGCFPMLARLLE